MLFKKIRDKHKRKAILKVKRETQERYQEGWRAHYYLLRLVDERIKNRTIKDQLLLLDYMIDSMLDDACADTVIEPLIGRVKGPLEEPFPDHFFDENGNKQYILSNQTVPVDLSKEKIYVRPWSCEKIFKNLICRFSEEFQANDKHKANYYADIKLCHVYGGNHSINAGRYFKKGTINAHEFDTTLLYPHIKTDGENWINAHTGEILSEVSDFRLACVYSLAQIRDRVRNTIQIV